MNDSTQGFLKQYGNSSKLNDTTHLKNTQFIGFMLKYRHDEFNSSILKNNIEQINNEEQKFKKNPELKNSKSTHLNNTQI